MALLEAMLSKLPCRAIFGVFFAKYDDACHKANEQMLNPYKIFLLGNWDNIATNKATYVAEVAYER